MFLSQLKKVSKIKICLLNTGFHSWGISICSLQSWTLTSYLLFVGFNSSRSSLSVIDNTQLILIESLEYHLWQPRYLLCIQGLPIQPVAHPTGLQEQKPPEFSVAMFETCSLTYMSVFLSSPLARYSSCCAVMVGIRESSMDWRSKGGSAS